MHGLSRSFLLSYRTRDRIQRGVKVTPTMCRGDYAGILQCHPSGSTGNSEVPECMVIFFKAIMWAQQWLLLRSRLEASNTHLLSSPSLQ